MNLNDVDIDQNIAEMAQALKSDSIFDKTPDPVMIGIHSGGVWVAEKLHKLLNIKQSLGTLDISFYRDDFTRIGINPQVKPSKLPFTVDGQHIILVDDVLYTGRTIRAALNEIFDYGRPAMIKLVTLVDRSGRELPIQADIVGIHIDLKDTEQIKLQGPEPLTLSIMDIDTTKQT